MIRRQQLGWPIMVAIIMIAVLLWMAAVPLADRFSNPSTILASIGKLSGIIAVVMYVLSLVLSTRIAAIEDFFGGLNKVYIAHHIIGGLALCVILIHPIALSLSLAAGSFYAAAVMLLPGLADWPTTFGILALWLFIGLMIVTFFVKLRYHTWLLTHKFLGLVFLGIVLHVALVSSDVNRYAPLKIYIDLLLSVGTAAYIYRTLLPSMLIRRFHYRVAKTIQPAEGVAEITLAPIGRRLDFKSGQFVFISFQAGGMSHEWHPFTISSNSTDLGLTITVKALGSYTKSLVKLAPVLVGEEVQVEGAYGRFSFHNFRNRRQIWIAGGIGITPFLSMVPEIQTGERIDLYYSVKNEKEFIEFEALSKHVSQTKGGLHVIPIVTDRFGFLDAEKIHEHSGDISGSDVLLCGPNLMMRSIKKQLKQLGVSPDHIHTEEFAIS